MSDLQDASTASASGAGTGSSVESRTFRNTATVLGARVASRLLALVSVLAIVNHLSAGSYGRFQYLVNATALVAVLVDLGFNTLYVREGARHPAEISRYLNNLISARLVLSLASLLVLAAVLAPAGLARLILPAFLLMVLTSYANLLRGTFYALQRVGYEAIAIVLESVLLLGLVVGGILAGKGLDYFVWAYVASYAFDCLYFAVVLRLSGLVRFGWRFELGFIRKWLWAGLPFALTFVITTIYFKVDVPILYFIRGDVETGWYGAAYKPFEALLFVPLTMLNVVFPVLSVYHREAPERLRRAVEMFYKGLLLLGFPISVGTFLLAPGLTRLLLPSVPQAEPALRILALGIVFMFVNNAFIAALNAIDKQAIFTWAALASLGVNLALNVVLIPFFGYLGASWATVLTEVALTVIGWALCARYLGPVPVLALSWRILLAGLVMAGALLPFREAQNLLVLPAILGAACVYAVAALLLRAVSRQELALLRRS
jgi:O-antigen/teichoic acid export membrane protein